MSFHGVWKIISRDSWERSFWYSFHHMATSETPTTTGTALLRKEMGLMDVVLFNIAAVLGPRWIARAAHSGQSSITLWIFAAVFFFVPSALVIAELSTRY